MLSEKYYDPYLIHVFKNNFLFFKKYIYLTTKKQKPNFYY